MAFGAPASANPRVNHKTGISIAALGVLALSFDAVLIRLAETSAINAAAWRSVFIAASLICYLGIVGKVADFKKLKQFGWVALFACGIYGLNAALFVFAVSYTTVANTVVILCSTPFFAAIFSWLLLREAVDKMTWFTIAVAVGGVVMVFLGAGSSSSLLGSALALILSLTTGFLLAFLRRHASFPRIPAVCVGAFLSAVILLPFASPTSVDLTSLGWLALTGCLLKPLASVCMLTATRYIPAPEVSIFLLLESLLAPIWAWFLLGERIADNTIIGGAVVLLMVAVHSLWELKHEHSK